MTDQEITTKEYELAFLGPEEQVASHVIQMITRAGGEVYFQSPVERIALEYKIKKAQSAHFGYVYFRLSPERLSNLRHDLQVMSEVLRFLLITPPFLKAKPRVFRPRPAGSPSAPGPVPALEVALRTPEPLPLSNEALEKRIEEILK